MSCNGNCNQGRTCDCWMKSGELKALIPAEACTDLGEEDSIIPGVTQQAFWRGYAVAVIVSFLAAYLILF